MLFEKINITSEGNMCNMKFLVYLSFDEYSYSSTLMY